MGSKTNSAITRSNLLTIAILLLGLGGNAQQYDYQHVARLKTGDISLAENTTRWVDSMQGRTSAYPALVLIHFNTLPTEQQKEQLRISGVVLLDYVPDNTFSAIVRYPLTNDNAALKSVYGITNVKPEWKADEYIWNKAGVTKGSIDLMVTFYNGIDAAGIRQFLQAIGAQINTSGIEQYGCYKITIASEKVHALAAWYGVQSISPATAMVPCDLQSRPATKGNVAVSPAVYGGYGLTGDSVTVGVGDNGSGIYHADIKDRITNFNPAPPQVHGSHVNGVVGSAGNVDPFAEGMAPHVSIIDYLYDQVIAATGAMLHNYNMTITNNSYGVLLGDCSYSGTYDGYALFLDTLVLQYPEVLHVFASANDGWMTCSPYPNGYATVGGGYTSAKNNLTVGSMTDFLYRADDESRGPTKDGRLKPETISIGLGSYSTVGVDGYAWEAGTSIASPHVAGGLAILTQHFKHLNGGTGPRADMLKAILLNGTLDLGNPGPDFEYGFGAMDVSRSLKIIDNAQYFTGTISNGGTQTSQISVPANTAQLKVMLCWNDMPASASSAVQLVNDLDLSVTTPSSAVHLPLVPDNTPANVKNVATERADHLNNVEQVTINNPAAGNYTINVNGFHVPFPAQRYVIAYDFVPSGTQLTFPIGGEALGNVDSMRIFWNSVNDGHTFTVQFTSDNGSNWTTLSDTVPATVRYCSFVPAGINSGNCKIRVLKNGTATIATSGKFAINNLLVMTKDTAQCPGYISVHWAPIPNATSYLLLSKKGNYMKLVGTISDTFYTFSGMSLTEKSYVSVLPVINGLAGFRSKALITIANSGNCANALSSGDLMIEKALSPVSGRKYTTGQLSNNETLSVKVRNLYAATCNNYTISYSINGGAWSLPIAGPAIPANSAATASVNGIDLSVTGTYKFVVVVHNLSVPDPVDGNDTIKFTVSNLANDTLALPFTDDFETMAKESVLHDSLGLSPNGHWDFATHDSAGRMRSFVNETVTIGGNRSVSLDEDQSVSAGGNNLFTGTFNLAAYDTGTTEVRLDFDYVLHGTPKTAAGNLVTYRASETSPWLPLFTYNLNAYAGSLNKAVSLSLTDAVRGQHSNFARNLQIAFGQNDTSLIAAANYGNGITLDNVKIYTVANDAQMVKIVSPLPVNCGLPASQPLTVQVHNGVNYTLRNVIVSYREDGGAIFTGAIDSITAKNTINYTFTQPLNMPAGTTHSADIWLSVAGDTYTPNDSLLNYKFRNNNIVATYPYLENFEAGDGGYYADGIKSSWQYGVPVSPKINKAASGTKVWKTNLSGTYNNLETSYLYSPCFDISSLSSPMLSFSTAMDIENCGNTLCDRGYIEYTTDGISWTKLGASGQGTNWYDSTFDAWSTNNFTRWHVASIPLPSITAGTTINFRFVLASDPGATYEGIAVDDIHIFDRANSIFPAGGITSVANNVAGNTWLNYVQNNELLASLNPLTYSLGNTEITLYGQEAVANPGQTQYILPRSYRIEPSLGSADTIALRLFLLESEVVKVVNDTTCPSCGHFTGAYSLGVTHFNNPNKPLVENNTLADDSGGVFNFVPYKAVQWVPYDNGYYAQFKTKPTGEFWFNDGGPTEAFPAGVDYLNFVAWKDGSNVQLYWESLIDSDVDTYSIERSTDGKIFTGIFDTAALHNNISLYAKKDLQLPSAAVIYYRLKWIMTGSSIAYYSPVRAINISDSSSQTVAFNATMVSQNASIAYWTSYIDGITNHYTLEREVNNRGYALLGTYFSQHHYGQQYNYPDADVSGIPRGAVVTYRLTATLDDGTARVFYSSIDWAAPNSVTDVYPNPSTDGAFNLIWYAQPGTVIDITLSDISGKRFYHTTATASQWKNNTPVQTPSKPEGVYILQTTLGDTKSVIKLVFE